jgi:hypothetical protein
VPNGTLTKCRDGYESPILFKLNDFQNWTRWSAKCHGLGAITYIDIAWGDTYAQLHFRYCYGFTTG